MFANLAIRQEPFMLNLKLQEKSGVPSPYAAQRDSVRTCRMEVVKIDGVPADCQISMKPTRRS